MANLYNTFAIHIVLLTVFGHKLFGGIGIAVYTKMATGVVHTYVFGHHAATLLTLTFVL
jgi:hypothetical protein